MCVPRVGWLPDAKNRESAATREKCEDIIWSVHLDTLESGGKVLDVLRTPSLHEMRISVEEEPLLLRHPLPKHK